MIDVEALKNIIRSGESLDREFKSDQRRPFSDKEIFEEIVALANTKGGVLLVGVEDNGTRRWCYSMSSRTDGSSAIRWPNFVDSQTIRPADC